MALTVTSAYSTANNSLQRTPVYKVTFAGNAQVYATHKLPGSTWKPYMQLPRGVAATIEPDRGRASVGSITFVLTDLNGEITDLVTEDGFGGTTVTFSAGFIDVADADFEPFFTGIVQSWPMTSDLAGYEITIRDPGTLTNKQVFEVSSSALTAPLASSITDTFVHYLRIPAGDFTVTNASDVATFTTQLDATFGAGNWSFYKTSEASIGTTVAVLDTSFFRSSGYLLIDDEILAYGGKTGTTFTSLTRGVLGTVPDVHTTGSTVTELLRIGPDHPMDIVESVLTNTDKTGLSIDAGLIDTTTQAAIRADMGDYSMEFRITDRVNAKTWLEDEIYSKLALYPVITGEGLISWKRFAEPVTAVASIDHDSMVTDDYGTPILSWDDNFRSLVNSIIFQYDYDPITDTYGTVSDAFEDAGSITDYGTTQIILSSKGFRSTLDHEDNFNRANNNALGTAVWTESELNAAVIRVLTNEVYTGEAGGGAGHGIARFTKESIGGDQVSELTYRASTLSAYSGPAVRMSGAYTSFTGYAAIYDEDNTVLHVKKYVATNLTAGPLTGTTVGAGYLVTLSAGDRVRIRATDDTIRVYVNDVLVKEDADGGTTVLTGAPGIVANMGTSHSATWDNWKGGDDVGNAAELLGATADLILARYANGGAPIVKVRCFMQKNLIEVGDIVAVTSALLPNKSTGQRGVTNALFEVINRTIIFDRGYVDFELLWTSWSL